MDNLIAKRFDPYITKMGFEKMNVNQMINKKKGIRLTLVYPHVCVEKPLSGTKFWNTVKKKTHRCHKNLKQRHCFGHYAARDKERGGCKCRQLILSV